MTATTSTIQQPSGLTLDSGTIYRPASLMDTAAATKKAIQSSFNYHLLRDQLSIKSWLIVGAIIQTILLLTLDRRLATLPIQIYIILKVGDVLKAKWAKPVGEPHVNNLRTTSLLPSPTGEVRHGTAGEKIAVLHLAFKNYSPLGLLAAGYSTMTTFAPEMFAELDTPAGRATYGFLGLDTYLQASSAVNTTSSSMLMVIIYFRSMEGVHAYARSDLHRKAWDWYNSFTKNERHRHLGVMHEVFEAPAGRWESVGVNIENSGLGRARVEIEGGHVVNTVYDASKGVLATAKGRIS